MPSKSSSEQIITSKLRVVSPLSFGLSVKERVKRLEFNYNGDICEGSTRDPESVINTNEYNDTTIGNLSVSPTEKVLSCANVKEKKINTQIHTVGKASSKKSRLKVPREMCPLSGRPGTLPNNISGYLLGNNCDKIEHEIPNQIKKKNYQSKTTRNNKTLPIVNASLDWTSGVGNSYTTNSYTERCPQFKAGNISPPPLQQTVGLPFFPSTREGRNCLSAEPSIKPKPSNAKRKNSFFPSNDDYFYNPSPKGEKTKHIRLSESHSNVPTVNNGKQWEFRMPDTDNAICHDTKVPIVVDASAGQQSVVDSSFIGRRNSIILKSKRVRLSSHPSFISDTANTAYSGKGVVPQLKIGSKSNAKCQTSLLNGVPMELIPGKHQHGTIGETGITCVLAFLESAVARERQLLEELSDVRKQILLGFRSIVKTFISPLSSQNELSSSHLTTCVSVTTPSMNTIPSIIEGSNALTLSDSLARVKCSVVVHTLATTIQQYARFSNSCYLTAYKFMGVGASAQARKLASTSSSCYQTSYTDDTNSETGTSVKSALRDTSSQNNDDLLDSNTIAQLKQLYFAYYDCESYVFDDVEDCSPSVNRLFVATGKGLHNVINEENVLLGNGAEDGNCESTTNSFCTVRTIIEDIDDETTVDESGEYNAPTHQSMLFNEDREICQIYTDVGTDVDSCEDSEINHRALTQYNDMSKGEPDTESIISICNDFYTNDISEECVYDEVPCETDISAANDQSLGGM